MCVLPGVFFQYSIGIPNWHVASFHWLVDWSLLYLLLARFVSSDTVAVWLLFWLRWLEINSQLSLNHWCLSLSSKTPWVFQKIENSVVVSNIFYFQPYLGRWSNLTNIFQMGWNHQAEKCDPHAPFAIHSWGKIPNHLRSIQRGSNRQQLLGHHGGGITFPARKVNELIQKNDGLEKWWKMYLLVFLLRVSMLDFGGAYNMSLNVRSLDVIFHLKPRRMWGEVVPTFPSNEFKWYLLWQVFFMMLKHTFMPHCPWLVGLVRFCWPHVIDSAWEYGHTFGGASLSWFDVSYFRPWIPTHQLVDLEDRNGTLYYLTSGLEVK